MFEIGWTEMLVIAIVMIVVVGPKDLPRMLRTFGKTVAKLRGMAGDFQKQFNEALKEAELDDVKKSIDDIRGLNPVNEIKKQLNPFEKAAADVRAGLDQAMKPSTSSQPAVDGVHTAEPLKTGAANIPGVEAPSPAPELPAGLVAAPAATQAAADSVHAAEPLKVGAVNMAGEPAAAKAKPKAAKAAPPTTAKPAAAKATPAKATASKPAPKPAKTAAPTSKAATPEAKAAAKPVAAKAEPAAAKLRPAAKAKPTATSGVNGSGTRK